VSIISYTKKQEIYKKPILYSLFLILLVIIITSSLKNISHLRRDLPKKEISDYYRNVQKKKISCENRESLVSLQNLLNLED